MSKYWIGKGVLKTNKGGVIKRGGEIKDISEIRIKQLEKQGLIDSKSPEQSDEELDAKVKENAKKNKKIEKTENTQDESKESTEENSEKKGFFGGGK